MLNLTKRTKQPVDKKKFNPTDNLELVYIKYCNQLSNHSTLNFLFVYQKKTSQNSCEFHFYR